LSPSSQRNGELLDLDQRTGRCRFFLLNAVYSGFEPALDDGRLVRPLEMLSKSGILQCLSSKRLLVPSVSPCRSDSCQCSLFGMGKDRFFTNCSAQLVPAPVEFVAVPRPSDRRQSSRYGKAVSSANWHQFSAACNDRHRTATGKTGFVHQL